MQTGEKSGWAAKKKDLAAVVALLVLTLLFFWQPALGRGIFFHEDFHGLFYPMKAFYTEALRAGRLPLWNPYISTGYPQFAEGQIAALYPLNPLLFGLLPLNLAFNYNVILHFALAGIFFFAFLRRRGLSIAPSFIGACVFQWSAFMAGHLQHPSIFCSTAWLPLLLYFLEDGLQRAQAGKEILSRALAAGIVLALQILVGYPPIVFYSLLIAFIYGLCRWVGLRKQGVRLRQVAGLYAGSLLVGIFLSTAQWLPTAELARTSIRVPGTVLQYVTSFSLTPRHLPTFVVPHFLGSAAYGTYVGEKFYWEVIGYLGWVSLLLIGLGSAKRWPRSWPLVAVGVIGLALSFGPGNPLYLVLQYVPGFNFFRAAGRYLLLWTVAGAALAGEGAQVLLDWQGQAQKRKSLLATVAIIAPLVCWVALQLRFYQVLPGHSPRPAVLPIEGAILGCGLVFFAAVFVASRKGVAAGLIAPALAIAVLADLFAFDKPLAPVTDPAFHRQRPWTAQKILADHSWYRVWAWRTSVKGDPYWGNPYPWARTLRYYLRDRERLMPNIPMTWHMRTLEGNAGFMRFIDFSAHLSESEVFPRTRKKGFAALLTTANLLGVKYLLFREPHKDLALVEHRGRFWLYRNPAAFPRAWVVGAAAVVEKPLEAVRISLSTHFNTRQAAILNTPLPVPLSSPGEIPAEISFEDPRPEKIIIRVRTARDGLLVLSEVFDTNWSAKLDGEKVPVYQTDFILRGVFLPAGEHKVEFNYDNIYIATGLRVSLLAALVCGLLAVRTRRKSRPPEKRPKKR